MNEKVDGSSEKVEEVQETQWRNHLEESSGINFIVGRNEDGNWEVGRGRERNSVYHCDSGNLFGHVKWMNEMNGEKV